jgi:hypothetical protein
MGAGQKSDDGPLHAAVCKCGSGVIGNSIDDAIEKLRQSYDYNGDDGHRHHEDTPRFNIILGSDGN